MFLRRFGAKPNLILLRFSDEGSGRAREEAGEAGCWGGGQCESKGKKAEKVTFKK